MTRETAPPTRDLDAESRKLWRSTRAALQAQGTWQDSDAGALERYVRAVERARLARAGIPPEMTAPGSKGQLAQHPNVKTAREAERDAAEYARDLLLTPRARKMADVPPPQAPGKFGGVFDT